MSFVIYNPLVEAAEAEEDAHSELSRAKEGRRANPNCATWARFWKAFRAAEEATACYMVCVRVANWERNENMKEVA